MTERQMPNNIEAEQGVLGSLLIDPEALDQVIGFLRVDYFYRNAHRQIYEAILAINSRGVPADFITLCDELEGRNQLEQVAGPGYVTSLINQVPTSGNIVYYARIVERTGVLRQLIRVTGEITALAYEETDAASALEQAERLVFDLSQRFLLAASTDVGMSELMAQSMEALQRRYENRGRVVGVPTGYSDLDALLGGLQRSDLVILAARTNVGKTALALNVAYNAALQGHKVGIFSLEMSREQLAQRFIAMDSGVEQQKLRTGRIEDEDWPQLVEALERLEALGIRIDDTAGISLLQMRSRARRWMIDYGIKLIIVDYLQMVTTGENRKYENRQQEVSAVSRGLKNLARELNVAVLALAQLSRAVEGRQSKVPQLSDLRESGSIEMEADAVMFLYRDELYDPQTERKNQADVIVAKQRNGPQGSVVLYFQQARQRFRNLDMMVEPDGEEIVFAAEEEEGGEANDEEE